MVCSLCGCHTHNKTTCALNPEKGKRRKRTHAWCPAGMSPQQTASGEIVMVPARGSSSSVRCGCGGKHLPCGTAKGAASFRAHIRTDRHMNWVLDDCYEAESSPPPVRRRKPAPQRRRAPAAAAAPRPQQQQPHRQSAPAYSAPPQQYLPPAPVYYPPPPQPHLPPAQAYYAQAYYAPPPQQHPALFGSFGEFCDGPRAAEPTGFLLPDAPKKTRTLDSPGFVLGRVVDLDSPGGAIASDASSSAPAAVSAAPYVDSDDDVPVRRKRRKIVVDSEEVCEECLGCRGVECAACAVKENWSEFRQSR